MAVEITATNDALYNNVVMASYTGFTDTSGTIDWGDGSTDTVVFPPAGQATHEYATTASPFTITIYDSGLVSQDTTTINVTSVTTRTQTEEYKRHGVHVQPTSISSGNAAFEAVMPASTDAVLEAQVSGDTQQRLIVDAAGKALWGSGTATGDTNLYRSAADTLKTDDNLIVAQDVSVATAGKTIKVKQGTNAKCGTATLNGTSEVVVSTTAVTANSIILLGGNTPAGTPAAAYVSAVTPGTSFGVKSAASNTSVIGWWIIEPAA